MIKKTAIIIFLGIINVFSITAQEYLSGLVSNPLLYAKAKQEKVILKQLGEVRLPFIDDFSNTKNFYPDTSLWADREVFINSGYAINPPTVGVATFDVINDTGAVYSFATPTPFIADHLTSKPIRLDTLFVGTPSRITAADSVYFSFFYQPQGTADAPNPEDSLILEFYSPHLNKWFHVWSAAGMTYEEFYNQYGVSFKQVIIRITDTTFLQKGFRFRFKNYASIASFSLPSWQSNVDQWNIDYVYLNTGRNKHDTVSADVAFVDAAPTILRNYKQMPARQFSNSELTDTLRLKISNLNDVLNNISYQYVVKEVGGGFVYTKNGGVYDILPFITNGYHNYPLHTKPVVDFTLPSFSGNDSVAFDITHIIKSNGWTDKILRNDTINYRQEFYNYYAYDDGSAENGYGLSGENAKLAYKFTLNQPDTLGGVKIYFNETLNTTAYKYFHIMVWSSLSPEIVLYKSKRLHPEIKGNINSFYTYAFEDTTILLNGTFYIGWVQTTDDNLNVGYDRNSNARQNIFYNVAGSWEQSAFNGALMIRPVMGKSWQQRKTNMLPNNDHFICNVYPNPPTGGIINVSIPENYNTSQNKEKTTIEIYDLQGRKIIEMPFAEIIDISALHKGIYFIRFTNYYTNETYTTKLIISR